MSRRSTTRWVIAALVAVSTLGLTLTVESPSQAMTAAGTRFLESLTPEQRKQATFEFDTAERKHWNYIPTELFPRGGLTIKQMTQPQRKLAYDLMKTGLSQRGYMTATQIMDLENVLGALEAVHRTERFVRDPERYFFSIFSTPSTHGTWGWRVEGHHVSLNFTVVGGTLVAWSPSFFGSNPAEVREGPHKGTRILALEEDAARALLASLDTVQRRKAIINTSAPNDIVTEAKPKIDPLSPAGVVASELSDSQRTLLNQLIEVYIGRMTDDIAAETRARLEKAGRDKIGFAWAGSLVRGQKHYYRVQGPTFLIEYDNTQNDANHIHSVWRDFNGDFGVDLLRDHVRTVAH